MTVRVLALNDDNHETSFVTELSYYPNVVSFMREVLLKPHKAEFEVRSILLLDLDEYEQDDFDLLDTTYDPSKLYYEDPEKAEKRFKIFNKFWEIGAKEIYV